ncbi:hypothetical protein GWI33_010170, partial [Rhynchophorus ferrugineus]
VSDPPVVKQSSLSNSRGPLHPRTPCDVWAPLSIQSPATSAFLKEQNVIAIGNSAA